MRILVTGGTGFIGSHVVQAAMSRGHDVVVLARNAKKVPEVFGSLGAEEPQVVVGDATSPSDVALAVEGCDAVVHAAAVVAMRRSESEAAHGSNTAAGQTVLTAAHEAGCDPIIHVSSVSVLDTMSNPLTIDSPLRKSVGGYARSKTELEIFVRGMQAGGAPVIATYPSGVFGPNPPALTAVHNAAQTWLRATPVMPSGINLVDVRDLADMHLGLVESGAAGERREQGLAQRYLMAGHYIGWSELYDLIDQLTGRELVRIPTMGRLLRALGSISDATRVDLPLKFPLTREAMEEATQAVRTDSSATVADLGIDFRPLAETVADSYRWLAVNGHVDPSLTGKLLTEGNS